MTGMPYHLSAMRRFLFNALFGAFCAALVLVFFPNGALAQQALKKSGEEGAAVFSAADLFPIAPASKKADKPANARVELLAQTATFAELRRHERFILQNFPLPDGANADLDMLRFSIFDENSVVYAMTAGGPVRRQLPDITLYRGKISGERASWVYLALERAGMSGTIISKGTTYTVFTPDVQSLAPGAPPVIAVYEPGPEERGYDCGVTELDEIENFRGFLEEGRPFMRDEADTLVAQIALEADEAAYKHYKTVEATENYIIARMGESSAIYERDVSIVLRIPFLRVWTTTDPFPGASDRELLTVFTNYWRDKMDTVSRTLAVLITRKAISAPGVSQGLAWLDVLCSKQRGTCIVKFSANNNFITGHVGVLAHEIGHNFGSHHTHSCTWNPPIDSCYTAEPVRNSPPCFSAADIHLILGGGEMMSYCHMRFGNANKRNIFRERVGSLVRGRAELALCMEAVSAVRMLALTAPVGGESLCAGDALLITWEAAGNNDLIIRLSSDGGLKYETVLASNIARNMRSWIWHIPGDFPPGTKYRIRIEDSRNETLVDRMTADFEIKKGVHVAAQNTWRNVCVGEGANFWVTPAGAGPFRYEWKKNGEIVPGAVDSLMWLQNLQVSDDSGMITCRVYGDCGSAESEPALLRVFSKPIIMRQPNNDTVCVGGRAVISLEAEGPELRYRWYEMPGGIIHEVNSPEFVVERVQQQKAYYCEVISPCGRINSASGFVIVPNPSASFRTPSPFQNLIAGGTFDVAWKAWCINDIKLEYSMDNGAAWNTITARTRADEGMLTWNVPTQETNNGKFRISDADNASRSTISPTFVIKKRPNETWSSVEVNFGWVEVGTVAAKRITISNSGLVDYTITKATKTGGDNVTLTTPLPFTVPVSQSQELVFEWAPQQPVPLTGYMVLEHNGLRARDTLPFFGEGFTTTSAQDAPKPGALHLGPLYPNPVNTPSATVTFALPAAMQVNLSVYTMLGVEIASPASAHMSAGHHKLTFDASALAPGTYILRLTAGRETRAMLMHVMR